jgi:hypothetical protein
LAGDHGCTGTAPQLIPIESQASLPGFFLIYTQDTTLTETISKSRERAEAAFGKTQSQFIARSRTLSEDDAIVQAREEKTLRLRELRMAKEASDLAAGISAKPAKNARKSR